MPLNPAALLAHDFGDTSHSYTARDAILYALGVGLGRNPLDNDELIFLDETRLRVLPSFAVTLCSPGMWIRDPEFGVDFGKLVHSAQAAWFPNPLPAKADVIGTAKVMELSDRGEGRGADLTLERTIRDRESGTIYCRLQQSLLLRGDGGFGGTPSERKASVIPNHEPDHQCAFATSPRAALIYRLSGDWNPLHIDPATAKNAGFERPILHGLASYGMAAIAVSRALGIAAETVCQLSCRFAGPIIPGDTLSFAVWRTCEGATFNARVGDRKVLDEGQIQWT
jgi:acyl dehydratase